MCEISLYVLLVYLRVSSRFSSFIPPAKLFFGVNEYDGKSTLTLPRIKQLISMDNWTRRDHILYACIKSLIWFHEHYFNDDYIVEMQYLFFFLFIFFFLHWDALETDNWNLSIDNWKWICFQCALACFRIDLNKGFSIILIFQRL